jgi:tetratricopeptide (TPR) repeat protein
MPKSLLIVLLASGIATAQTPSSQSTNSQSSNSTPSKTAPAPNPNLEPPHSDRINAASLANEPGDSSSKEDAIDLSPPEGDQTAHPRSSDVLVDEGSGASDGGEIHPWNPHQAAKDVEVGDFYFKRKNYIAAEARYRDALLYKENDAVATYRLAACLEKMDRSDEAIAEYESYLKILPSGPEAPAAKKAIEHLKASAASAKSGK